MENRRPHITKAMECPVLHKKEEIGFDVNVFHVADHGGLNVTSCAEFGQEEVTCGKDCIHTQEARELHGKEVRKHQGELKKIGPNVLG
ncbi:MAG: hypothetical protein D4R81_04260 [Nitrospiraceae bacterium]|nr:MAG: hypothetical protein D4R81_04260 [Nitrospiraceae bacterium]